MSPSPCLFILCSVSLPSLSPASLFFIPSLLSDAARGRFVVMCAQMCEPADTERAIAFVEQWVQPTCMVGCSKPLGTASVYEACQEARTLVQHGCMQPCLAAPAAERTLANELLEICNLGTQSSAALSRYCSRQCAL